jgi:hypothetical protein
MHHVPHGPHGVIQALCQVGVFRGLAARDQQTELDPEPPDPARMESYCFGASSTLIASASV